MYNQNLDLQNLPMDETPPEVKAQRQAARKKIAEFEAADLGNVMETVTMHGKLPHISELKRMLRKADMYSFPKVQLKAKELTKASHSLQIRMAILRGTPLAYVYV